MSTYKAVKAIEAVVETGVPVSDSAALTELQSIETNTANTATAVIGTLATSDADTHTKLDTLLAATTDPYAIALRVAGDTVFLHGYRLDIPFWDGVTGDPTGVGNGFADNEKTDMSRSAAQALIIFSSEATDDSGDVGATNADVTIINASGARQVVPVVMAGIGEVTVADAFSVERVEVTATGSSRNNDGILTVSEAGGTPIYGTVEPGACIGQGNVACASVGTQLFLQKLTGHSSDEVVLRVEFVERVTGKSGILFEVTVNGQFEIDMRAERPLEDDEHILVNAYTKVDMAVADVAFQLYAFEA